MRVVGKEVALGWGGGGEDGTTQSVRGNYKPFKGTYLTVVEGTHQVNRVYPAFIQPVRRGRSVRLGGGGGRGIPTALGRVNVYLLGACYTRGARSRQSCGYI